MKRFLKKLLSLSIVMILLILLLIIFIKADHKNRIAKQTKYLPEFSFINLLHENNFSRDSVLKGKSCLILYFNSECEHCQKEATQIHGDLYFFSDYQILMVSSESKESILAFKKKYQLDGPFIKFLQDQKFIFEDVFGATTVPTSFIYNKDKLLIKRFYGEVKTSALLHYLAY